ncbi:preprotein translocase subunit SecA [Candidatus Babeliales bacterium]|nr:preprotein translocase subunit SecA [Candidatus Babeliales bacterium]MCF7899093.1 preprotein translocase subunit SecA [Candidatus Babeliales bacterium]
MIAEIFAKILGTKNERELKRIRATVHKINLLEEEIQALQDHELTEKTNIFRERISRGESIESILPEAFAVVRETSKRKLGERHYDVQLIGGIVLHEGKIAEMKTGEGKTLTSTLPLYLNALEGKGAHLITVNDYLAKRDADWMSPVYHHLNLEVGVIQNMMNDDERKKAYNADITYGTNNEFGFDYLRDNMKFNLSDYVQRDLHYAIVDEVDSILIDEARTPLIISGASEKGSDLYAIANRAVLPLKKEIDYDIDEKAKSVQLTESGIDKVEHTMNVGNIYAPENILYLHHIQQALRANTLFTNDVDYVVKDGEVLIVDEFTGRILPGRRYSDGLHQALEAKEGVKVERENQTLATITLQNYFRMYKKLAGMTGTAETEASEFHNIYKLGVVAIPTHKPMIRDDQADIIFLSKEDKFNSVAEDILSCYKNQQPVLVGTIAIETSEYLSHLLNQKGIPHNVLNAKQHAREAEIIKEAGEPGKITIATNMAGRGTDIKLTHEVKNVGGLRIIGTERHESRRIDNQLRGRAGRQGDPGSSKFYLSLEDDLIRIFGGEKLKNYMMKLGMQPGESIEHKMLSKRIEKAQEKVEKYNFGIRKHLIEYDDVLNQQRTVIYDYRRDILEGEEQLQSLIKNIIIDIVSNLFAIYCPKSNCDQQAEQEITESLVKLTNISKTNIQEVFAKNKNNTETKLADYLTYEYEKYRKLLPEEIIKDAEKWILLETVDQAWKNHLQNIDHLKEGIGLRGYGQKNPLIEYKKEAFELFQEMMYQIKWDIAQRIFRMRPENFDSSSIYEIEKEKERELSNLQIGGDESNKEGKTIKRENPKAGRNDPCPCGSGKKYKKCCGN